MFMDHARSLGTWNGFLGREEWTACAPMARFTFSASSAGTFQASGVTIRGVGYKITGDIKSTSKEGSAPLVVYSLRQTFTPDEENATPPDVFYEGTLDGEANTLCGVWRDDEGNKTRPFFLTRTPPDILVHRPPPDQFESCRIRTLWTYAIQYARHEARTRLFSRSLYTERREAMQQYVDLARYGHSDLPDPKQTELSSLNRRLTYDTVRYIFVREQMRRLSEVVHR